MPDQASEPDTKRVLMRCMASDYQLQRRSVEVLNVLKALQGCPGAGVTLAQVRRASRQRRMSSLGAIHQRLVRSERGQGKQSGGVLKALQGR